MPKVFRNSTNRSYEDIVPRDEPIPKTSWGQAVIKVKAVSLNYRDLVMSGSANPLGAKKDLVPLSDASGVIVEVGEGVEDVQVGDHVVAVFDQSFLYGQRKDWTHSYGGAIDEFLREYADVPASSLVKIPKDSPLTWAQWACLPCAGVTAWNALYGLVPLRSAQTVLLEGTYMCCQIQFRLTHASKVLEAYLSLGYSSQKQLGQGSSSPPLLMRN